MPVWVRLSVGAPADVSDSEEPSIVEALVWVKFRDDEHWEQCQTDLYDEILGPLQDHLQVVIDDPESQVEAYGAQYMPPEEGTFVIEA